MGLVVTDGVSASSLNPSTVGTSVTFTAIVAQIGGLPVPTGTVTFYDSATPIGSNTLSGGTTTFTTSSLNAGMHSITAVHGGDSFYDGSTFDPDTDRGREAS